MMSLGTAARGTKKKEIFQMHYRTTKTKLDQVKIEQNMPEHG